MSHAEEQARYFAAHRDAINARRRAGYKPHPRVTWQRKSSPEERFWANVIKGPTCWEWTGAQVGRANEKYGHTRMGMAHRVAYELLVGPIPKGLVLDHLCRNRLCVNPAHLEPVTQRTNILRGNGACARRYTGSIA